MQRKHPFVEGEMYHVYTRGVEKRTVFECEADYHRFIVLLLLSNSREPVRFGNLRSKYRDGSSLKIFDSIPASHAYTDILAYALMPNHVHLVLREKKPGGISFFMQKLMTAYSMYFNKKYERSGPLFTRPFRAKHVDGDEYLRWLFAYVHLNPLDLVQPGWKEDRLNAKTATKFMRAYHFSSFHDFFLGERPQASVLNKSAFPINPGEFRAIDDLLATFYDNDQYEEGIADTGSRDTEER